MKRQAFDPALYSIRGSDLPLSGAALLELMRAVLARGVPFRFRAKGWSMAPLIRDGDVICVSPLPGPTPGLGDVVAFVPPEAGKLVVHRVIARQGAGCLIQGDNVPDIIDGLLPPECILGRVTRVERGGREVWLGLGPERFLIAWLSRAGLLQAARLRLGFVVRPFLRRCSE